MNQYTISYAQNRSETFDAEIRPLFLELRKKLVLLKAKTNEVCVLLHPLQMGKELWDRGQTTANEKTQRDS